jgi:hypothetical protein
MLLCGLKQTKEDNFGAMPKWEQLVQLALDRVKLSQEEQNIQLIGSVQRVTNNHS